MVCVHITQSATKSWSHNTTYTQRDKSRNYYLKVQIVAFLALYQNELLYLSI